MPTVTSQEVLDLAYFIGKLVEEVFEVLAQFHEDILEHFVELGVEDLQDLFFPEDNPL